ncbi:MAG TPA: hypothetical protein PK129_06190 [Cellvibrionaceae bacterium]|nr:hypothetical protein [Cellvibrionaceae bacterium]
MFDATLFEATYQDSYTAASISDECYNQSKIKAKEAFDTFNKTQEKVDATGFTFVAPKASKKQVGALTHATASNALKTGAIMAGLNTLTGKYVAFYAMSGNSCKTDVNSLRSHCAINSSKHTYCAEENLIVSHLHVRFYACIAFRIDESGVVVIPPCGNHKPFAKCKQTLRLLAIGYVMKSADL